MYGLNIWAATQDITTLDSLQIWFSCLGTLDQINLISSCTAEKKWTRESNIKIAQDVISLIWANCDRSDVTRILSHILMQH